jgi:hypothetical protein
MRLLTALFCILLSGCSFSNVEYLSEGRRPEFSKNLYQIVFATEGNEATILKFNPFVEREIERRIKTTLLPQFRESFGEKPALLIYVRLESEWDPRVDDARRRSLKGLNGSNFPDADPRLRTYQERRLVMDISDADTHEIYWKGSASRVLNEKIDGGESQIEAAGKLMGDFLGSKS